jgi:hypothetical protein
MTAMPICRGNTTASNPCVGAITDTPGAPNSSPIRSARAPTAQVASGCAPEAGQSLAVALSRQVHPLRGR